MSIVINWCHKSFFFLNIKPLIGPSWSYLFSFLRSHFFRLTRYLLCAYARLHLRSTGDIMMSLYARTPFHTNPSAKVRLTSVFPSVVRPRSRPGTGRRWKAGYYVSKRFLSIPVLAHPQTFTAQCTRSCMD